MSAGPNLESAIERLYRTFARYKLRKHVEGCPHCIAEPEKRALESAPLRQLTAEALGRYAFKAMTTWGDRTDFKYFFPRIFELAIDPDGIDWDIEVVLGKLALAEWKTWDQQEQNAVREFLRAEWVHLLAQTQPRLAPENWLCGIARAGDALQVYLRDWVNARSTSGYEHLVAFVESNEPRYIQRHSLTNPFWPDRPDGVREICDWAASPATRKDLETIYFGNDSAEFVPALSKAIQRLEWVATA
jgi:hypothetical protein